MANVLLLIAIAFKAFHILSAVNGLGIAYFRKIRPCLQRLLIRSSQNTVLYAEKHLFQSRIGANIAKNAPNRSENEPSVDGACVVTLKPRNLNFEMTMKPLQNERRDNIRK